MARRREPDLLTRLASRDAIERADAERELAALGLEGLDALFAQLEADATRRMRSLWTALLPAAMLAIAASVVFPVAKHHREWRTLTLFVTGVLSVVTYVPFIGSCIVDRRHAATILRALRGVSDIRSIPHLLRAMPATGRLMSHAEHRLIQLLPRVCSDDRNAISSSTPWLIIRHLDWTRDPEFVIASVQALVHIGDKLALSKIERIAAGKHRTARDPRVSEAARECAAALRERLAAANTAATLLRPASAPDDTLLRPASAPVGDVDVLLRPAGAETAAQPEQEVTRDAP
jgi:hypothetical protein